MKKRIIVISSIAAAVIILGLVFLWIILPRIMIYNSAKVLTSVDNGPAPYFTQFDLKPDSDTITIDNGEFSVNIPADYIPRDKEATSIVAYTDADKQNFVGIFKGTYMEINLFDTSNSIYEQSENIPDNMDMERFRRGFEKLGHGIPDCAYNTYKCAHLLSREDYSFWDLEKAVAFSVSGIIREISANFGDVYIYETEEICGILNVDSQTNKPQVSVFLNFYKPSDLNTEYTLYVTADSAEDAYAIVNSVKFI